MIQINLSDIIEYINNNNVEETIFLLINWPYGFGSALLSFLENIDKLSKYNIHLFPYWILNSNNFKYSTDSICSFNIYFTDNKNIEEYINKNYNIIFVYSDISVINGCATLCDDSYVNTIRKTFNNRFKINDNIINTYNDMFNEEYAFSIHLRSNFQKNLHDPNNLLNITNICNNLQKIYNTNTIPFIATDVKEYLNLFLEYFPLAHYNKDAFRIDDDTCDSMPLVNIPHTKYGIEIMIDIIGLSKGRKVYLSNSNIEACVKMIYNWDNLNIIYFKDMN